MSYWVLLGFYFFFGGVVIWCEATAFLKDASFLGEAYFVVDLELL
jgi:hypothetical protein